MKVALSITLDRAPQMPAWAIPIAQTKNKAFPRRVRNFNIIFLPFCY